MYELDGISCGLRIVCVYGLDSLDLPSIHIPLHLVTFALWGKTLEAVHMVAVIVGTLIRMMSVGMDRLRSSCGGSPDFVSDLVHSILDLVFWLEVSRRLDVECISTTGIPNKNDMMTLEIREEQCQ